MGFLVDTTIPLWGIIVLTVTPLCLAIWNAIVFYFDNKQLKKEIERDKIENTKHRAEDRKCIDFLESRIDDVKAKFSAELESHKKDTQTELSRLNAKLDNQGTVLTRIETMVELWVKNKIKD